MGIDIDSVGDAEIKVLGWRRKEKIERMSWSSGYGADVGVLEEVELLIELFKWKWVNFMSMKDK